MTWRAAVLTLFPAMFPGPLAFSLAGRALQDGRWALDVADIRDAAQDRHRSVDDAPFGGGAGMVMRADVLDRAIPEADGRPLIYLSPRGRPLDQARVRELAAGPGVVLLCGRFEGVDQRLLDARGAEEISIGDYVLSGGEIPALALLDACVRLFAGCHGEPAASAEEESFGPGPDGPTLEYSHYTRPAEWQGRAVPAVLLSGNHGAIAAWRRADGERITRERPARSVARAWPRARPQWTKRRARRNSNVQQEPSMNIIQQLEAEQIARLTAVRAVPEIRRRRYGARDGKSGGG